MKWKFGKSFKLFYFQMRESPAPFDIPTPTPAPDRGGLAACLDGPVASWPKATNRNILVPKRFNHQPPRGAAH